MRDQCQNRSMFSKELNHGKLSNKYMDIIWLQCGLKFPTLIVI